MVKASKGYPTTLAIYGLDVKPQMPSRIWHHLCMKKWYERKTPLGEAVADSIRELMRDNPKLDTQQKLAKKSGIGQTTIGRILRGEVAPTIDTLDAIASAFGVDFIELALYKDNKDSINLIVGSSDTQNVEPGPEIRGLLPLISWVQAGNWTESPDMYEVGDAEKWMACPVSHGNRSFALRVSGPSMDDGSANGYRDGEIIYVDPDAEARHNDDVIVKNGNGEATFKRLVCQGEKCYLVPLNKAWPDQIIPLDEHCTVIGKVIFSGRER